MENEMMNEVVTEAITDITTQAAAPVKENGLKNVAIAGGIMTLGALAWEFGVKPAGRRIKKAIQKAKNKRKEKSGAPENDNWSSVEDPEEEYPIK